MAAIATPSATGNATLSGLLESGAGAAQNSSTESVSTLTAAVLTALASFGAQFLAFYLLRWRLTRIYRPKTYLVAERQRMPPPQSGPWQWIKPIFSMPNGTVIHKCGLDAYFFLRYLRMLLKIFVPAAFVILPILLPINHYSGDPANGVKGVNVIGWQNISTGKISPHAAHRLWAHLILAVLLIIWFCYVVYDELRGYIRIRQAYLTSPQHRIRASATTVLVSGIPRKWLTLEALNGLYDVFPGGIRNIWINRDFDELLDKVQLRDKYATQLEDAETVLIKKCVKKHKELEAKKAKEQGQKTSRSQKKELAKKEDQQANQMAQGQGYSSGDPNQTPADIHDAADDIEEEELHHDENQDDSGLDLKNPLKLVGHGIGALGHGIAAIGQKSKNIVTDVADDLGQGVKTANNAIDSANTGGGFIADDSLYKSPNPSQVANTPAMQKVISQSQDRRSQGKQPPGLRIVDQKEKQSSPRQARPDHIDINVEPPSAVSRSAGSNEHSSTERPDDSFDRLRPQEGDQQPAKKGPLRAMSTKIKAHKKGPALAFPSPQPHMSEKDEYPLGPIGHTRSDLTDPKQRMANSKWVEYLSKTQFWKKSENKEPPQEYPQAFNDEYTEDQDGEPQWLKYITVKDRETIRLPIVKQTWFPSLPLMGEKVDRIYHLRRELARLNAEIEADQNEVEKYPFMNSAFIQFNHQIAAHMACQSVSHHIPQHMAPRLVEISPSDVIWSNMSIKWWERYIRTGLVVVACIGLIILFAIPVGFTGFLSQVSVAADRYPFLAFLAKLPPSIIGIIQGVLPPVLLAVLLALVPIIFRFLVQQQGVATGSDKELGVQRYYFFFLFVQVFLVASVSKSLSSLLIEVSSNPVSILTQVAGELPSASTYFFSYMIVQALGNSASALLQVGTLVMWFLLGPFLDSTARAKWRRQTTLSKVTWGSYFPPFTNFAVIGLVFSIISPLIMLFNLVTFSLFWFVQRYNVIYVYIFTNDTGGLLFPEAVNQLFTGIYVMEVALIGLFFITQTTADKSAAIPQGVIMIVMLVFTIIFQVLTNQAFAPLLRYLPITLEDEAVIRDEEFSRAQAAKWQGLVREEGRDSLEGSGSEDIEDRLESRERREEEADRTAREQEKEQIRQHRRSRSRSHSNHRLSTMQTKPNAARASWKNAVASTAMAPANTLKRFTQPRGRAHSPAPVPTAVSERNIHDNGTTEHGYSVEKQDNGTTPEMRQRHWQQERKKQQRDADLEGQKTAGDVLFSGFSDELEDLTVEERDTLVRYSFQHAALRARRPVVWIPRDPLGVSDDEIARSKLMSTVAGEDSEGVEGEEKTFIWMSNEGTALDGKNRVVFRRSPPDFASVDLIAL